MRGFSQFLSLPSPEVNGGIGLQPPLYSGLLCFEIKASAVNFDELELPKSIFLCVDSLRGLLTVVQRLINTIISDQ